jgi:hypothetical protein
VALIARLIYWWILVGPVPLNSGDANFYYEASHSIANNLTYSKDGQLTAAKTPGYPIFAGIILKFFKKDAFLIILQYLFGVLASIPIFLIARNYLNEKKALFVAFAYLLYPTTWHWESQFMSESLFIWINNLFFLFMHNYLLNGKLKELCLACLFGALSFLIRPAAIFTLGLIYSYLIFCQEPKRALKAGGVSIIIFIIIFCPWVTRNYKVFGHFIPGSTSAGITIYTSYVNWGYDMSINNPLPEDRRKLSQLGSAYERDKYLIKRTISYLKQYPSKIITLAPVKLKDYFHPFDGRWYPLKYGSKYNIFYGVLISLAVLALFWYRNRQLAIVKLSVLFLFGGILSAVIFHGEIRYRFVLNPIFFLLAGLCFADPLTPKKKKVITVLVSSNIVFWGIGIFIP